MCTLSLFIFITTFTLTACGRDMIPTTYSSNATVGKVVQGTIVSARPITIKDSERLQDNTVGILGGGAVGGIAGSAAGDGTGQALATAGGAIAGATLGAILQEQFGTDSGMEYVVKLDSNPAKSRYDYKKKEDRRSGANSIDEDVKESIVMDQTGADMISVIQGDDEVYQPGQRVYIIYHNDRPRIQPIQ